MGSSDISELGTTVTGALRTLYGFTQKVDSWIDVAGSLVSASENSITLSGNKLYWIVNTSLFVKSGNHSCTLYYNGRYYVRLQSFTLSDVDRLFPWLDIPNRPFNSVVKSFITIAQDRDTKETTPTTVILVKEDSTTVRLVSDYYSDTTSGTKQYDNRTQFWLRLSGLLSNDH